MKVKVICINDTNKPKEIPTNKWITKGDIYHITHIYKSLNQNNIQGCELSEIDISMYSPYGYFRLNRFAIFDINDLEKLLKLMIDCSKLNDCNIDELKELLKTNIEIFEEV